MNVINKIFSKGGVSYYFLFILFLIAIPWNFLILDSDFLLSVNVASAQQNPVLPPNPIPGPFPDLNPVLPPNPTSPAPQQNLGNITVDPADRFSGLCSFASPRTWLTICWSEPIYNISNTLLIMAGATFDYMLDFTLDTCVLASQGIRDIWSDMRDIANLTFILGLIFISFSLITGSGASKAKDLFVRLIIIAIVLNFSLFTSKVIIDAGNISALTFYNAIDSKAVPYNYDDIKGSGVSEVKSTVSGSCTSRQGDPVSIAGALVGLFNPARIFESDNFQDLSRRQARSQSSILMAMFLGGAVINVLMAKEVFLAGFLFISRTMWLIILMVLSPLAFVTYFLPGQDYLKRWFNMIVNRSFCVVAYLFFLWLIIKITQGLFSTIFTNLGTSNQQSWDTAMILVIIQFAIVFGILKIANKTAMKMCDDGSGFGAALQKVGKGAVGLALGVTTGGVGLAARSTIGRGALKAATGGGRVGGYLEKEISKGNGAALFARNKLKNIGNLKFGTSDGYEGRLNTAATKKVELANEVETLKRKRTAKDLQNRYATDERIQEKITSSREAGNELTRDQAKKAVVDDYKLSSQYIKDEKVATKAGEIAGSNVLAGQSRQGATKAGSTEEDGYSVNIDGEDVQFVDALKKPNILKKTVDSALNGFTGASDEGLDRRQAQFDKKVESKQKNERDKQKNADDAYLAEKQKSKISQEGQRVVAGIQNATNTDGEIDVKAIMDSDETKGMVDNYMITATKAFTDKNGKVSQENSKKIVEMKKDLEDQIRGTLQLAKEQQELVRKDLKEQKEKVKLAKEEQSLRKADQDMFAQIRQEISNSGKAEITEVRKKLLAKEEYGLDVVAGSMLNRSALAQMGDFQSIASTRVNTADQDLNEAIVAVGKKEREFSDLQKQQRKNLSDAVNGVTKVVNARISSVVKGGDAELFGKIENRTQETQNYTAAVDEGYVRNVDRNTTDGET